ncbi:DUF4328 domain-containing protein [Vicingaceae bacterium]|nr:DUF4328 domain-containing protein [Vicingaceae bacterium]
MVTEEMVNANDLREQLIGILYMLIYFTSAVFYIRWFKSCYSNLGKRTITNEKESMAIWGWIIPIISLFKPYQMMKEMWTDTSLKIRLKEPSYKEKATTIIGFCWFLWLVTNVIGNCIFKFAFMTAHVNHFN